MICNKCAIATVAVLAAVPLQAAVTFNLIPELDTPQCVIDGFNAAASLWSSKLADNITVNIEIGYSALGPNIIGETSTWGAEASYSLVKQALAANRSSADDFSSYAALPTGTSYLRLINHTSDDPAGPNSAALYPVSYTHLTLPTIYSV